MPFCRIEVIDHVAIVTLEHATMPPAFFAELTSTMQEVSEHPDVRAVLLKSQAKAFSYGLDLPAAFNELGPHLTSGGTAGPRMQLLALIRKLQGAFNAVSACPVPVVAAIHGWCIGGGLDLAAACDIRLCTADARFSLRETKIAMVADLGSLQRLPPIIGQGHTRELAFTGKDVPATRAREIGLVNDVFSDVEALLAGARALCSEIAANPPLAVRGVKQVLGYGEGKTVAEGLEYVAAWNSAFLASEDLGEALSSFMEKRPPRYSGR
ncbi:crotonase/enoyl-CoA hydratase family protein [Chondromyces crocatus]|uniref:Enoyl-CoA hydratase n=1 Tax=Chondromyces crocatus TaxID=52 RepID=A0A0K1EB21_CHOCO|nr:crotonase/enoyl-CoA hydratase family protein [Chondromyces crocatus]AKT38066.1 enoyl-CoA hydratase [Chondromyces crocatus]